MCRARLEFRELAQSLASKVNTEATALGAVTKRQAVKTQ
jgi:hypothetical protein